MENIELIATKREVTGKQVKALRREGKLPAVIYGRHLSPLPILLNSHETNRVLPNVTSSQLITVNVDGTKHTVLVREKQRHPVLGSLIHVDFLAVSMTETLRANVLIELEGEAPAVKNYGGVVVPVLEEVEVECLPKDLPDKISVDLSSLENIGDAIHVKDLITPDGVDVLTDAEEVVVLVKLPEGEEVEAAVEGAEPEVIEKGKKEEEEF
ncbi:MAG: 50S ribosomal protein L25 [Anaerolineales bacterium]